MPVSRILGHARTRHGGLDIVVHNAGITRDKLLANTDADRWASVLDVNLGSILRMNEAFLGKDGLRQGGHVVLVSSIAGIAGNRGQTNYAASKAGRHRARRRATRPTRGCGVAASRSTPSRPGSSRPR